VLARRFLYAVAGLTILVIAGVFAYRVFAPLLMRAALVPDVSFAQSPKPPATFYNRPDAWLARPGIPGEPVRWTPEGFAPAPKPAVAVFYVHPTTYLRADRWNAPVALSGDEAFRREVFLRSQASVFNGFGEIWAPKYRQATFGAFLSLGEPDAMKAFALAYTDIEKAFDIFLAETPPDRKIILAGHSQGSLHLVTLLARRIAGTPVARRIVAAYLIGWPISIEADLPALGIGPCAAPEATQCIVSYQSYAEPAETRHVFEPFFETTGLTGLARKGSTLLCTNPLDASTAEAPITFDSLVENDIAEGVELVSGDPLRPERNLGTLIPLDETYADARLVPGLVGAECTAQGYLTIGDGPPEELRAYVLPGNNYHVYDYPLFWSNLRADVERRTQAALRR
jgi:hypothetical protein